MTRPQIVRADTIDLQDQHSPSAKDHSSQHVASYGIMNGGHAPHQEAALRSAAEEQAYNRGQGSPRVSNEWGESVSQQMDAQFGTDRDLQLGLHGQGRQMNGNGHGMSPEEGDMADAEGDDSMDDDMMDKISSSPSIDDEDIDFEFVYALHTFIATVEGQANATKGDTMVLLDDSNSYWWLVRIVKDNSIGYLPAEHIETPTERLARLNKHRNMDTMLGDNPEKSKNPLKKAMRRRNAKTVQFAAPTYLEASDYDYSTDEDAEDGDFGEDDDIIESPTDEEARDEVAVEPLHVKAKEPKAEAAQAVKENDINPAENNNNDVSRERITKNGTVRNTDSFFRDDTVETRKISLTPNLLRDEGGSDSKEVRPKASLEAVDKNANVKEEKRKKEKKPGILDSLFKRKDKKNKNNREDDADELLGDSNRDSTLASKKSLDEATSPVEPSQVQAPRPLQISTRGKLQKQPPANLSPASPITPISPSPEEEITMFGNRKPQDMQHLNGNAFAAQEKRPEQQQQPYQLQQQQQQQPTSAQKQGLTSVARLVTQDSQTSDLSGSSTSTTTPQTAQIAQKGLQNAYQQQQQPGLQLQQPQQSLYTNFSSKDTSPIQASANPHHLHVSPRLASSLSESPEPINYPNHHDDHQQHYQNQHSHQTSQSHPPPLLPDTSSNEDEISSSPVSPTPSSPEIRDKQYQETPDSTVESSSVTPTWSDASLRQWLESSQEVRDLLVVVHDKSGVVPVGKDHPVMGTFCKKETERLNELNSQLDSLLGEYLARRKR